MQAAKPIPAYGISKAEYARRMRQFQAYQNHQPSEGLFARLKKRFR